MKESKKVKPSLERLDYPSVRFVMKTLASNTKVTEDQYRESFRQYARSVGLTEKEAHDKITNVVKRVTRLTKMHIGRNLPVVGFEWTIGTILLTVTKIPFTFFTGYAVSPINMIIRILRRKPVTLDGNNPAWKLWSAFCKFSPSGKFVADVARYVQLNQLARMHKHMRESDPRQ